jgi:hypothetical protein
MARQAQKFDGETWFDHWQMAGTSLLPLADDIRDIIRANFKREGGRDIQVHRLPAFNVTVTTLVANLATAAWETNTGRMAVHMPTAWAQGLGRYVCPDVPVKMLKRVLDAAETDGFLSMRRGRRGIATTISPTPMFRHELDRRKVAVGDVLRRDGEELIILSRKTKAEITKGDTRETRDQRQRVPYEDDNTTNAMRSDMILINTHLATADLGFEPDSQMANVNVALRRLRRHFNLLPEQAQPSFDNGGRLFGAFWSNLDRARRRASLRIDGEHIAEVDFNAMFTRLAYAKLGEALSDDDPYTAIAQDLKAGRSGIKQGVNALFFTQGLLKRWPSEIASGLPKGVMVRHLYEVVVQHLPALEPVLGTPIGYSFMRTESDILVASMRKLITMGITALPLHDATLVARSKAQAVKQVLEDTGLEITGVRLPVGIK